MTLRKLVEIALIDDPEDPEEYPGHNAVCALTVIYGILRSIDQREQATEEGIAASVRMWIKLFGEPTNEKVRAQLDGSLRLVADIDIPEQFIEEFLEAE